MRVLLVSANREDLDIRVPALGLACVAAAAESAGHPTGVLDLMTADDEETRQAYYLIKSRALVPPLVTVNRRLCLYGELDADSLQAAIHQELERRCAAPRAS